MVKLNEMKMDETLVFVYKYRWVVLIIYCLYAAINFAQFLQYTIINNIVTKYYSVDGTLVDLTGLIFMITFIVLCLPGNYLIERYNLRIVSILSCALTTLGNCIKLLSVHPDRIYVVHIGQLLCAIAQVFMLSIPSKLASTWFGPEQVSTACAFAVFGTQIGIAIGSIVPAVLVQNSDHIDDIGRDLFNMHVINSSVTAAIFVIVLLFFRAKPKLPPSLSQVNILESEQTYSTWTSLKTMFKSKDYILLLIVIGVSNGMWSAFGILINQIYLQYFPNSESDVGIITCITLIAGGCFGSVLFGYILDRFHRFKLTTFIIVFVSAILYIFVVLTLELQTKIGTYISFPLFGFFLATTLVVGFEFATEIMYPIPESASCSILNSFIYLFSIIFTLILGQLFDSIGYTNTHIFIFVVLLLGSFIPYFMKANLNRRNANISV